MKRLEKLTGVGNVQMVDVEVPSPGPQDALVKVKRSLISRGSELFARYVKEEAVSPEIMGYSDAGAVVDVGAAVAEVQPGDRVMVQAPHAQYVVRAAGGSGDRIRRQGRESRVRMAIQSDGADAPRGPRRRLA